jgi:hypothetical protein
MFCVASLALLGWGALGFFLLFHMHDGHSDLPSDRFWQLDHLKSYLCGFALGLLIAMFTNPEFWRRPRRSDASV